MLNVQVVLFDGFDLLDAIAPYEVFCAANLKAANSFNVQLVTAEGARLVSSGINGLPIEASGKLDPERADIIVVPGASGEVDEDGPDSVPAILGRAAQSELTELMKLALARENCIVVTVCGGSLVLAMAGLLEGRPAVTNHLGMDFLGATGAIPVAARVVDDGNLISGGGVTSGLDAALYVVERELGPQIAHAVEQLFEFERRGTVWRATGLVPKASKASAPASVSAPAAVLSDEKPSGDLNRGDERETSQVSAAALFPEQNEAAGFNGDWDTVIATPVGKLQVMLSISIKDGVIQGTATQGNETVSFLEPKLQHSKLSWSLRITKPMRLNLKFEVTVEGNTMLGVAKAGVLPASKVTGTRISQVSILQATDRES